MVTRGSYVHNSMVEFRGHPENVKFYAIFSEYWWFQTKRFTGLLELVQLYKQNLFFFIHFHHLLKLYIGFKPFLKRNYSFVM